MPIQNIYENVTGQIGIIPQEIYIQTDDTLAEVTAVGYLNSAVQTGFVFANNMLAHVYGIDFNNGNPGVLDFQVSVPTNPSGGNYSLTNLSSSGEVTLPVTANHIATFVGTTGNIGDDAATAINGGNIQAGLSATAGYLASFPATAAKGSLRVVAANSAGDTVTQITNASQAAARTYTIPDGGQSASNFLLSDNAATQTIATGSLALTLGNITAAAGAISATLGAVSAGTTVTAGTGVTATTGNVVASAGNVSGKNLISGFTSTVSAAGTLVLTAASNKVQEITGTTTHIVQLPVASTLATGTPYTIINNSTGAVTVNSSGGNAIQVMSSNTQVDLVCILASGTDAASWQSAYISDTGPSYPLSPANGGTGVNNGAFTTTVTANSSLNQDLRTTASPAFVNIYAGSSGVAGTLTLSPPTAASGSFVFSAANNAGANTILVKNASFGQSSIITLPDPGAASASFLLDTGAANILAEQQFVSLNDRLLVTGGTWTMTRIAEGDYGFVHTPADDTSVLSFDITPMLRAAASKGFRLNSFDVIYSVGVTNLDAHTIVLDSIAYANNVANAVTSVPLTGSLAVAVQANPYVTNLAVTTPAFLITADAKYVVELTVNAAVASTYTLYGMNLHFSQTIA